MTPAELQRALTAWAQGEWDRRHPIDPRAIPRLLRDHLIKRIGPGIDGAALPGETRTALRPDYPDYSDLPVRTTYWLWSGWESWGGELAADAALIYTDSSLSVYLTGPGTEIPFSDPPRTERLIAQCIKTDYPPYLPSWPGPYPWLEGSYYPSPLPERPEQAVPCLWTGEAVRMHAALQGAIRPDGTRRTWADVLPAGWAADPTAVGIFWLGTGDRFFAGRVSSDGIQCQELTVPKLLLPLLSWIRDGDGTPMDQELFRSWVYAYAQPLDGTPVFDLAGPGAMDDAYLNGATSIHPEFGVHWLWQPDTHDPAGCVATLTGTDGGAYLSRDLDVEFTLGTFGPMAQIGIGQSTAWGGAAFRYWAPLSAGSSEIQVQPAGVAVLGTLATVYRWTSPSGVHTVKKLPVETGGTVSLGTATWPSFCGDQGESHGGSYTHTGGGGWSVTGPVPATMYIQPRSAQTTDYRTISVETIMVSEDAFSYNPADTTLHIGRQLGTGGEHCSGERNNLVIGQWYNNDRKYVGRYYKVEGGRYTVTRTTTTGSGGSGTATLVLLPGSPGVLLAKFQHWTNQTQQTGTSYSGDETLPIFLSWEGSSYPQYNGTTKHTPGFTYYTAETDKFGYFHSGYGPGPTLGAATEIDTDDKVTMITARGTEVTLDPTDWDILITATIMVGPWSFQGPRSEAYTKSPSDGLDTAIRPNGMEVWAGEFVSPVGAG